MAPCGAASGFDDNGVKFRPICRTTADGMAPIHCISNPVDALGLDIVALLAKEAILLTVASGDEMVFRGRGGGVWWCCTRVLLR